MVCLKLPYTFGDSRQVSACTWRISLSLVHSRQVSSSFVRCRSLSSTLVLVRFLACPTLTKRKLSSADRPLCSVIIVLVWPWYLTPKDQLANSNILVAVFELLSQQEALI